MSHHPEHEFGQPWGWPHEFTRADYGDTVETPEEKEKEEKKKESSVNFEMLGHLWEG